MPSLLDKVVIVTGAGRGIGRAEALFLAAEGARVVVVDSGAEADGTGNDATVADAVAKEITQAGGRALAHAESVVDFESAERVVAASLTAFGRIDGAVCNAGIVRDAIVQKTSEDDFLAILGTHLRGPYGMLRAVARTMVDGKTPGSIVLTTSPDGFFGSVKRSAQAAASGALVGVTRSVAAELKRHGVRVNAIAPTARTRQTEDLPMFKSIRPESMSPEHVAPLAAFLLSDQAADITGEVLGVAGARAYAFRVRETAGAFSETRPFTVDELAAAYREIVKGG